MQEPFFAFHPPPTSESSVPESNTNSQLAANTQNTEISWYYFPQKSYCFMP